MLFKDGVRSELSKDQKKELLDRFKGRFPLRFIYPKEKIKDNKNNPKKPFKPHAIWIPFKSSVKVKGAIEEWHYTRQMPTVKNGQVIFKSDGFYFTGLLSVGDDNLEFLYYLLYICPLCSSSVTAKQAKVHYMELYDKRIVSADFIEKETHGLELKTMILVKHTEERVRKLAKAVGIDDVDDMTLPEVRTTLYKVVSLDDKMFDMCIREDDVDGVIETRALIKDGIDVVLKHEPLKKRWYWIDKSGNVKDEICVCNPTKNYFDSLIDHFAENKNDFKILKAALGKKEVAEAK